MPNPAEQLASKAMGAMKAGKAAIEGLTGIFRTLAKEHGEVSALLLRVKSSDDPQVRAELFPKIRKELLSHEQGEVTVLYPAYRTSPGLTMIADKHDQEAGQLQKMIANVVECDYQDPEWASRFDALVDLVQRHVAEEEGEFFPKGQELLADRTSVLDDEFKNVKSAAMNSLA